MTDTHSSVERESLGTCITPEGALQILAYLGILRDEREVRVLHLEDDSFAFETTSWLRTNGRKEVKHQMRFSRQTFVQLMQTLHLAASYFGIDIQAEMRVLASAEGDIHFEYAGNGEFLPMVPESDPTAE